MNASTSAFAAAGMASSVGASWFTFYLFDRHGTCLSYTEWKRTVEAENELHEHRNLFGVLWSLRQLCAALDPSPYVAAARERRGGRARHVAGSRGRRPLRAGVRRDCGAHAAVPRAGR